jgi:UDP-N-acetylglucosamine--N-acetylmuramyl-(pentapeptide) pyrophosphoryl-undecaprenol N-acetylglucosamine transferase
VNASVLVNKKAALLVPDAKVKSELFPCLLQLVNDEQQMKELKENISKLGNTNADEVIADEILKNIAS